MSNGLRTYIINIHVLPPSNFSEQMMFAFHQYLQDSAEIAAYWNYIPLLYMVKTHLHASELAPRLIPFLGPRFIVAEIYPFNVNGQLPKEAWDWLYFPHQPKGSTPQAQQALPGLAELFGPKNG